MHMSLQLCAGHCVRTWWRAVTMSSIATVGPSGAPLRAMHGSTWPLAIAKRCTAPSGRRRKPTSQRLKRTHWTSWAMWSSSATSGEGLRHGFGGMLPHM